MAAIQAPSGDLVLMSTRDRVTTLRMNLPGRLNGWTMPMIEALKAALAWAAADPGTGAVVLTGTDPYYSAGVNLGGTVGLMHPRKLRSLIVSHNRALFDAFIAFDKPILVAANGPAIGASVTTASLCDGIMASTEATFSTPFAALSVPAEGCSSVVFPRLLGPDGAERMLGAEGWKPTAEEAKKAGLVQWVVPHGSLLDEAQGVAAGWVQTGRSRTYPAGTTRPELEAINAAESERVADAFLARPFLRGQYEFLWRKKKRGPALMFLMLWLSRPLWALLL